ncbi:DUF6515 family protein [Microbulbifer yueqingensis]|uniref:Uncharacterized protein n=1 Tax=Microbulbifer yueqingensis TaxID=658219 RepID=A0A1G8UF43_9GAMM|nr:DUF6515 family protein [Microbulbifer yueqingensis]SDJ52413.1 hypothetical protein SAMN05216212_0101 [Microbulbifer yueqingensis]
MRYAIAVLFSLAVGLAWADDRVRSLPSGASQILIGGQTYYYWVGSFYRPAAGGFIRVESPVGARVPNVPGSSGTFTMGGERYYVTSNGTFFVYEPDGDDFTVVTPPYGWRDYYSAPQRITSLAPPTAVPAPAPVAPPAPEIRQAYPPPPPAYRGGGYYGTYRSDYGGYYGRYRFRDDIGLGSYRELQSKCRRIASDQSRRAKVGPYRREPGTYREEYARCLRYY